ncbi:MAG: hypothetical protein JW763_10260 [candidate division Zixibacteria bacterium]|nr:hypothetical protein [candidate division Zixibacteria bacterium]
MSNRSEKTGESDAVVFATFAQDDESLIHIVYLAESIREFGGICKDAPIWVYLPDDFRAIDSGFYDRLENLNVEMKTATMPADAGWFYYAGKTFASGQAEADAQGKFAVLVWLDEDTIFLREPADLLLKANIDFAYRPIMHNRSGTLYGQPTGEFWGRIYKLLELDPEKQFAMVTPADRQTVRAYFNAGILAVRPEIGILRGWGESFKTLYRDSTLARMCRDDVEKRIFLHQTALVGPVMHKVRKERMTELSGQYNYPIFFKKMYGAENEFDDISDVVTLRYDFYFRNPEPDWAEQLKGPDNVIAWMKSRLGKRQL